MMYLIALVIICVIVIVIMSILLKELWGENARKQSRIESLQLEIRDLRKYYRDRENIKIKSQDKIYNAAEKIKNDSNTSAEHVLDSLGSNFN